MPLPAEVENIDAFSSLQEVQSGVKGDTLSVEKDLVVLSASNRCVQQSSTRREAIVAGHHTVGDTRSPGTGNPSSRDSLTPVTKNLATLVLVP